MKTVILIPFVVVALAAGALLFLRREDGTLNPPHPNQDLRAGKTFTRDLSPSPEQRAVRFADLATRQPKAAEAEAMLLEGHERDLALELITTELAKKDSPEALRVAGRISDPIKRGNSLGYALAQQAAGDPEAVFGWLDASNEEEAVRAQAERMALPALAEVEPTRVANWIAAGKATPQGTDAAVVTTVQRWVQKDAGAAAQWVATFDDARLLHEAMHPLIDLWTKQEPSAPSAWIEGLPSGLTKDEACAAYAMALAPSAPEEARKWAAKIATENLGKEILQRLEAAE